MQLIKNSLVVMIILIFSNFQLCAETLFTAEKGGFNAYKIENSSVQKSTWKTDSNIFSFSGTKNGIAIALIGAGKYYRYESIKKDFFVLSQFIIPQNEKIQKIVFSYDAKYAAVVFPHEKGSKMVIYRKNESSPCIDQISENAINDAIFSQDGKIIIVWHQKIQEKIYDIAVYNIESGEIVLKTILNVPMGYSGLWPLNVRCTSINKGIFISHIGNDMQYQYRKVNINGTVDNISEELFCEQIGAFLANNKGIFKFINHEIIAVIKYNDYFEDGVVVKSIISPNRKYVALATTKGYYVIELTTKKSINISPKIFNDFFCWGE